jgi:hypothetical protein
MTQAEESLLCKLEALNSNPNPTKTKQKKRDHIPLSSQFHSRDARMVQQIQIDKCNTVH